MKVENGLHHGLLCRIVLSIAAIALTFFTPRGTSVAIISVFGFPASHEPAKVASIHRRAPIMMNRAMKERSRLNRLTGAGIALGLAMLNAVMNARSRIARLTRDSIAGRLAELHRPMKDLSHILRLTRVSVFVSSLGAVVILVPDQFSDALKSVVEYSLMQLCVVALSALLAAASISLWGRFMIARLAPRLLHAVGFSGWAAVNYRLHRHCCWLSRRPLPWISGGA
jgi:hypothetical protein